MHKGITYGSKPLSLYLLCCHHFQLFQAYKITNYNLYLQSITNSCCFLGGGVEKVLKINRKRRKKLRKIAFGV